MQKYIRNKEAQDELDEIRRKRQLKMKENETKRILDIQMQQKNEGKKVNRFEADTDAKYMDKDIKNFTQEERAKYDEMMRKLQEQQSRLLQ